MSTIDRKNLRLADLKTRTPRATRMLNVKLPLDTIAAVDRLAKELKVSKTDVVVALLNEGLAIATDTTR